MALENNDRFRWRETYQVHFDLGQRPKAARLLHAIAARDGRLRWVHVDADEGGLFRSATILAPDAYAALEIRFSAGESVLEQAARLADAVDGAQATSGESKRARLSVCDARLDVLHYEEIVAADGAENDSMLNPSALLGVLRALTRLTQGIAVDAQNQAFM